MEQNDTKRITWDCHMHSSFSADSDSPMEEMILSAVSAGLSGITFTEHYDPDYPPVPDGLTFDLDLPSYRRELISLKEKYQGRIEIRYGIELGLQPHLKDVFSSLVKKEPFDFVIGSSHVLYGQDPYYPSFFEGRSEEECYREYFRSILENLTAFSDYDVYGHLDYIVRYGPNRNREFSYQKYADLLEEILRLLIGKNIGLELNTGGYHCGLGEPNPSVEILRRYRELGGTIVTVGSDSHSPERIAFAFDKAARILRDCGFRRFTVFRGRTPVFLPL